MANSSPTQVVKAGYWWSESSSPAADINTDLFTHLFFAFADVDPVTKNVVVSSSKTPQVSTFSNTIKQSNPNVKTLLSIKAKAETFAAMAEKSSARKAFIDSSIKFARKYDFDGLDLQWLCPAKSLEMTNLGLLLEEWHDTVSSEAQQQQKPQLLLVATVFYSPYPNSLLYPTDAMKDSLDWINVVAYDIYTPANSAQQTGPAAGFFNSKTQTLSVNYGLQQWVKDQKITFPPNKIVLGLPFYGWAWLLRSATNHSLFSPTDGVATGQTGVSSDGRVEYRDIVKLTSKFSASTVYDDKEIFSYAYYNTVWIGYEDGKSISAKISKAKELGLLGYFAWHIGGDDEESTLANTASQQWDA